MKPLCHRYSWVVAVSASMLLVMLPRQAAEAFCPTNGVRCALGLVGQTHKDITVGAIRELEEQEFFGTAKLTKGMKRAIKEIAEANGLVDKDQTHAAKHFDGETFGPGHARLETLFDGVVSALQDEEVGNARSQLGQALHTVQDFYSHSNWTELGHAEPNTDTWREGHSVSPTSPLGESTCVDCPDPCDLCESNLITSKITSGYYGGETTPKLNPNKCNHGGPFDSLSDNGHGINKDVLLCGYSPHNFLHPEAAATAKEATKLFIKDLKDTITPRQLKQLLGVGPTLAIAIDDTNSMKRIISGIQGAAIRIVQARLGTDQEPIQYVLEPFNDPKTGPLTVTSDPGKFMNAILALRAHGPGLDCPELSMTGTLRALEVVDEGTDLFLFTDADSKDGSLVRHVRSIAKKKGAKIYALIFGDCEDERATSARIDPAYISLADDSGGQLFFLQPSEAGNIARLADLVVRSNAVDVLSIGDTFSGTPKTYTVPVDSTMSRVTFSASGTDGGVVLKRPNGATVNEGDPDASILSLSTGTVFSMTNPTAGAWSITLNGAGSFSLDVTGESGLSLDAFEFVELAGRPGHEGLFSIQGFPVVAQPAIVAAELSGGPARVSFDLRSKAGDVLEVLSLAPDAGGSPGEFFGDVSLPAAGFLAYATGTDLGGFPFQRVLSNQIEPQTIKITAPAPQDLNPGQTTTYSFQIQNFGASETFRLTANDDWGFLGRVSLKDFTLGTNMTVVATVELLPPKGKDGALDTLTVTVESLGASGARNFAVLQSLVTETPIPTLTELSPAHLWIGLRNSDDQGTQFDLKVELLKNGTPVASALSRCITGVTRNPSFAKEVVATFDPFSPVPLASGDVLALRVSTRIGTNPDGTKCRGSGGSHNNAVGLRLYYDSTDRVSQFGATITPIPNASFYLHSDGGACGSSESGGVTMRFLDGAPPDAADAKCKDSGGINFAGGNVFSEIGTWSLAPWP